MTKIDIDKLSEDELIELNHKIVARLQLLNQMRAQSQMLKFKIGDHVCFQLDEQTLKFGLITRYNKKTVTVITDSGEHWNISPGLLPKAKNSHAKAANDNNKVIEVFKE